MDVLQFASEQEASLWREVRVATRSTKAADAAVLAYRARAQGKDKALANLYRAMLSVKSMAGAAGAFRLGYVDRGPMAARVQKDLSEAEGMIREALSVLDPKPIIGGGPHGM